MYILKINEPSDWQLFFGHFHPVVVHLPIGILCIAFLLEIIRLRTKNNQLNSAIILILFWGFISAIISCIFGWLLSLAGGYNEDTLSWHQWMGISVAAIAGLLWLIKKWATKPFTILPKVYLVLIFTMMGMITITGHLGGNLTHGEDYLTENTPQPFRKWLGIPEKAGKESKKITDINEAIVYKDLIAPVMETKCLSCHNATKSKGGLRMDTEALLMKGGKHGAVITAKSADGSELLKRVLLPESDEKRMPPKGKPGLTTAEIALVKWWINSGASFAAKVKDVPKNAEVQAYFKAFGSTAKQGAENGNNVSDSSHETPLSAVFQQKIVAADKTAIDLLKKENLIVSPISQTQPFLDISAVNNANFDDSKMPLFTAVAKQLVWLKLSNTKITDAGFKVLNNCKNLVKLNIENTAITSNSIGIIKQFQSLEYLNIIGTKMDDKALLELASIKSLKSIYCWQTAITANGVAAFKKINPTVNIDFVVTP